MRSSVSVGPGAGSGGHARPGGPRGSVSSHSSRAEACREGDETNDCWPVGPWVPSRVPGVGRSTRWWRYPWQGCPGSDPCARCTLPPPASDPRAASMSMAHGSTLRTWLEVPGMRSMQVGAPGPVVGVGACAWCRGARPGGHGRGFGQPTSPMLLTAVPPGQGADPEGRWRDTERRRACHTGQCPPGAGCEAVDHGQQHVDAWLTDPRCMRWGGHGSGAGTARVRARPDRHRRSATTLGRKPFPAT